MTYLYETHMHTCQGSACGKSTGAEQARYYSEQGYAGIFVTDHFSGGNTRMPRTGTWKERVEAFCAGYEDALIEGQKRGLAVFFGWEQNYDGDEYLIYGPDKAWLIAHPDVEHWTRKRQLEEIHKAGGAVIHAHPFRDRDYLKYIQVGLKYCDGIEVANAGNKPFSDVRARNLAAEFDLLTTAGSDNHHCDNFAPERLMGVELDSPLESALDYARRIRTRARIVPHVPAGWFDLDAPPEEWRPAFWIDEANPDLKRVAMERDYLT